MPQLAFYLYLLLVVFIEIPVQAEVPLGSYPQTAGDLYPQATKQSLYVSMSDGNRLAVDLYLPAPLAPDETAPAVVQFTRYWREAELVKPLRGSQGLNRQAEFFARRGYAVLRVDVRGTGASFGSRPGPWGEREVQDGCELVQWITKQPWSNGRVGAFGDSYSGTSAALLATCGNPAVGIVIPRFYEFDVYTDIAYPGGVFHQAFVRTWSEGNNALDQNRTPKALFGLKGKLAVKGVAPVDGEDGHRLLKQAVAEHHSNVDVHSLAAQAEFRDRKQQGTGISLDTFSLHQRRAALESSPTALYMWGSWLDAGTANSVLAQVMNLKRPLRAVIGPWNHGADHHASPYLPPNTEPVPRGPNQWNEFLHAFDHHLKGIDNGFATGPRLIYYTLGEERWKSTDAWPPANLTPTRWYLQPGRGLASMPPPAAEGVERYPVDFSASTGVHNRWYTQHGDTDVIYGDRREASRKLLTYTSEPLETSIEITGHPVLTLQLSSTTEDNALFVYLEDVAPNGVVRYVTEGQLRLATRHLDENPPYNLSTPQPSFREADSQAMEPGKVEEITLSLLPTSVVIGAGHRLRLAIAGHDAESFQRIPAEGPSTLEIHHRANVVSFLQLPMVPRNELDAVLPGIDLSAYAGRYRFADGGVVRVRAEQAFLRLGAEDPKATEHLVRDAAGLKSWGERSEEVLEALRQNDRAKFNRFFVPNENLDELWKFRKKLRRAKTVRFAGTDRWLGNPLSAISMESEDGRAVLLLSWSPASGRVERWGVSQSLPGHGRYLPRTAERFEGLAPRWVEGLRFEFVDGRVAAVEIRGERAVLLDIP